MIAWIRPAVLFGGCEAGLRVGQEYAPTGPDGSIRGRGKVKWPRARRAALGRGSGPLTGA